MKPSENPSSDNPISKEHLEGRSHLQMRLLSSVGIAIVGLLLMIEWTILRQHNDRPIFRTRLDELAWSHVLLLVVPVICLLCVHAGLPRIHPLSAMVVSLFGGFAIFLMLIFQ